MWVWGGVGGCSLVGIFGYQKLLLRKLSLCGFVLSLIMTPVVFFVIEPVSGTLLSRQYTMPFQYLSIYGVCFLVSGLIWLFVVRQTVWFVDVIKRSLTKKTSSQRDGRTDVRDIATILPSRNTNYDPKKYFRRRKVFIGLSESGIPRYISTGEWRSSHCDLIGTTGSGKGVAAGVLIAQSISQGEAVFVLDPKEDEFLPHLLGQEARENDRPFYFIDLTGDKPQWNPYEYKTANEIEELLSGAFGQVSQGGIDDFYRGKDRACSRLFAKEFARCPAPVNDVYLSLLKSHPDAVEEAAKFNDDMLEVAQSPVTNVVDGFDIGKSICEGAVVYVRGSMRSPKVLKLQKSFVLSVMQNCESRDREAARSVAIFLDEFKYLISRPALEALGAIRDKRAHIILAHQSLGDLKDCPKDIDPQSVLSSVNENCRLKLAYRVNDPDTADWLSRMSGTILIDDETRIFQSVPGLAEVKAPNRHLRQAERPLIDSNMLLSLPKSCAVLFGSELAKYVFISPVRVKKEDGYLCPTVFAKSTANISQDSRPVSGPEELIDVD